MITILSPAKNLDFKSNIEYDQYTIPEFLRDSELLVNELRRLKPKDIEKLMNVSNDIANLNFERNLAWKTPFNRENAKPAIFAFKGQVYHGLKAETLKSNDLKFAQNHLRILSGLYGILKPLDLIQAYRLEMGTKLKNERGKNLYNFWGDMITDTINRELENQENKVLVNLASNEYYKVVKADKINGEIITPVFKEQKGDQYKVVTVYAKTARGLMSRFILQNRIEDPEHLKAFVTEGYLYNRDLSTKKEWVFTR